VLYKTAAITKIFVLLSLFSTTASARLVINPPTPYPQYELGTSGIALFFAGQNAPFTLRELVTAKGYRNINTADLNNSDNFIWLDVQSDKVFTAEAGKTLVAVLSVTSTAGSEIPLKGAVTYIDNATLPTTPCNVCQGSSGTATSAIYTSGSKMRLMFSLASLEAAGGQTNAAYAALGANARVTQSLVLTIGKVSDATSQPLSVMTDQESLSFTLAITSQAPTMGAAGDPTFLDDPNFYFPGDQEIILMTDQYGSGVGSGPPLQYYLLLAKKAATPTDISNASFVNNDIVSFVEATAGAPRVDGFANAESDTDTANTYEALVYAVNQAGLVAPTAYSSNKVRARSIEALLKKSKCFIATTAYHSGDVGPVKLLRRFRDQILSRTWLGQSFIEQYYRYSPRLAEWAWNKPWVRMLALKWLTPLEILAWFSVSAEAQTSATADEAPGENYINKIKKQLAEEDAKNLKKNTSESTTGSYTEDLRNKMGTKNTSTESHIDLIKRTQMKDDPKENTASEAKSYIEKIRSELKPVKDPGSVIARVKAGDTKLPGQERPPIQNAFSIRIGVSPGIDVSVAGATYNFEDIYGNKWKPDVLLHYERQLFHSENFGSFGPSLDFGVSQSGAKGKFKFAFNGSLESRTSFSLLQVPFLLGAVYRFNLLRILRPYAQVNGGPVGLIETRNDDVSGKKDYSLVYSASAGVSLLLDFLDPKTMRDAYDSAGYQHIFAFIEYTHLATLSGDVKVSRDGIYSGFMFEF
jgi:hypothetical protein